MCVWLLPVFSMQLSETAGRLVYKVNTWLIEPVSLYK